jgi:hypothetical protein
VELPPELKEVIALSVMNPGTILAGFLIGRRADQWQKIVVGAFASGIAGALVGWILWVAGFTEIMLRSLTGVFVLSSLLGVIWTWIGFTTRKRL